MRRHTILVIFVAILALLTLLSVAAPAYASDLNKKQQEKQEIDRQLKDQRENLKEQRRDEEAMKAELDRLDRRLQELQSELNEINGEIAVTEEAIARAEVELAAAEQEFACKEDLFKRRLKVIYEQGHSSYIDVLLGATSFGDFLTRFNNLRIIATNDQRLVEEIRAERNRIKIMKEELEQEKSRLDGLRRETLANKEEVDRVVATRETVLKELQQEIARNLKTIQDLERESQRLESLIGDLMRSSGGKGVEGVGGKLCWPIESPSYITSGFGWRRDPFSGATTWHGAIDIGTYGQPNYILAAEGGRVILASWNGGYGNCIIIDHGGGTATLYAHLSSYLVGVGQAVSRGQRIGRAGTTGNSTGVHLHFEVREYHKSPYRYYPNGTPDYRNNPMSYL
ncbi:MAG: peptidoglycan DD-metalloendopeptidase family protein [Firmicutes bacterium]|nr:peptidoglycan DD-metalloendopeptidase family protein [Bacillota bacterium]